MDNNKPTYSQIQAIYRWLSWRIPMDMARDAVHWLRENATRKEVSVEMGRIRTLYYNHTLDESTFCASDVWRGYRGKEKDNIIRWYNMSANPDWMTKEFVKFWHNEGFRFVNAETGEEIFKEEK